MGGNPWHPSPLGPPLCETLALLSQFYSPISLNAGDDREVSPSLPIFPLSDHQPESPFLTESEKDSAVDNTSCTNGEDDFSGKGAFNLSVPYVYSSG